MSSYVVGKPKLYNKDLFLKRISDIIDSQWWGNGGYYLNALESHIQEYFGCNHAIAVSNATVGIGLAIETLFRKEVNDRYFDYRDITCKAPSFTFAGTVSAAKRLGINIDFADIDDNYCLDPKELEGICQWDFVIPVNAFGNICHKSFYEGGQYPMIWDNAHSTGVFNEFTNTYVGVDCQLGVFSGHSTKMCGSGEIGIITCQNEDAADYIRELRNFGYVTKNGDREGKLNSIGTNAKVSEIQAAMYLTQLENIQEIQEHYFNIHKEYERLLDDIIKPKNNLFSNYSYVVCEVDPNKRDRIIQELNIDNIFPRTYFTPLHTTRSYLDKLSKLPNTMRISSSILALPTGCSISLEDVKFISEKMRKASNE